MKKFSFLLSATLMFLTIVSFRFAEIPATTGDAPDVPDSTHAESVCETEAFEFFYVSSDRYRMHRDSLYNRIFTESDRPDKKVFDLALRGYASMLQSNMSMRKNILAFVDYSLSANKKRFWVVDLKKMKLLYHELVAHGRNTGEEYARRFSNKVNSFQSSLGFFITGEVYNGKHEMSIKLSGVENSYNGKAFDRGIVIHGADYVSEDYIRQNNRLGRSLGCPAVSQEVIASLSSVISDGVCLFLYYPNKYYLKTSRLLNKDAVFAMPVTG